MTVDAIDPPKRRLNKRWPVFVVLALLCIAALLIGAYVWFWGQYRVSTNDAYVDGNIVEVFPKVSGTIRTIRVNETDYVAKGQVLATIEATDYKIRFAEAKANLASTLRQVQQMFDKVGQLNASLEKSRIYLEQAKLNYAHREALVSIGGVSQEEFENALTSLLASEAEIIQIQEELKGAKAQTYNASPLTHPLVSQAIDQVKLAWLNLKNTTIRAPVAGYVAKKSLQLGENADLSQTIMAIVPLNQLWITANFKENQLSKIRIGQSVQIKSDLYKNQVIFTGKVLGISPGTGSVFSILPPQNATGNWIKIVQRVPVRIQLTTQEIKKNPLRLGLSTEVVVDVHNQNGGVLTPAKPLKVLYQTNVYDNQLKGIDPIIDQIVQENLCLSHER